MIATKKKSVVLAFLILLFGASAMTPVSAAGGYTVVVSHQPNEIDPSRVGGAQAEVCASASPQWPVAVQVQGKVASPDGAFVWTGPLTWTVYDQDYCGMAVFTPSNDPLVNARIRAGKELAYVTATVRWGFSAEHVIPAADPTPIKIVSATNEGIVHPAIVIPRLTVATQRPVVGRPIRFELDFYGYEYNLRLSRSSLHGVLSAHIWFWSDHLLGDGAAVWSSQCQTKGTDCLVFSTRIPTGIRSPVQAEAAARVYVAKAYQASFAKEVYFQTRYRPWRDVRDFSISTR